MSTPRADAVPGQVYALDWSPNGQRLASGSKDRTVKMCVPRPSGCVCLVATGVSLLCVVAVQLAKLARSIDAVRRKQKPVRTNLWHSLAFESVVQHTHTPQTHTHRATRNITEHLATRETAVPTQHHHPARRRQLRCARHLTLRASAHAPALDDHLG